MGCNKNHLMSVLRCTAIALFMSLVVACASTNPAPVDHRPQPPSQKITTHEVGKGETLYSIAWAYGLNFQGLARANNLDRSYTIYPGQILKLTDRGGVEAPTSPATLSGSVTSRHEVKQLSHAAVRKAEPIKQPVLTNISNSSLKWQWPADGSIIGRFGTANKGIDIAGKLGDAVRASASGDVVYSGSGLLGYGQLIIVKHNDQFLSAYAHNRVLLVKEGDSVKAGDKIAEIGSSGTEKVKLHFEIRRDGKPVDPEQYLPRR